MTTGDDNKEDDAMMLTYEKCLMLLLKSNVCSKKSKIIDQEIYLLNEHSNNLNFAGTYLSLTIEHLFFKY